MVGTAIHEDFIEPMVLHQNFEPKDALPLQVTLHHFEPHLPIVYTQKSAKAKRKALAGVSSHKSCRYKTHVQTLLLLFYVQSSSKAPGPDHAFKIAGLFWERNFVTIYLLLIYVFFFFFFVLFCMASGQGKWLANHAFCDARERSLESSGLDICPLLI